MTFNLRLPDALDLKARAVSVRRYQSLNTFICLALEKYLEDAIDVPVEASKRALAAPLACVAPSVSSKPSKAERRAFTDADRARRKLGF